MPQQPRAHGGSPSGVPATQPGVILVAHGSSRSPDSAEPVLELARELRRRGFSEVRTAFWREEPFLHQALETVWSSIVAVLPVFLAEGYFSRVVVPRELGLDYELNRRDGSVIRLLRPLGTAPGIERIVAERALDAIPPSIEPRDVALIVLGHGTPRDARSAETVMEICRRLADEGLFRRVLPAFIDQDPEVVGVIRSLPEPMAVLVPFLVAPGWHGGVTVPQELEITDGLIEHAGRTVVYAQPVGLHGRIADLAQALIEADPVDGEDVPPVHGPRVHVGARLERRLQRLGRATFLQVQVLHAGRGRYELRHVDDAGVDLESLAVVDGLEALEGIGRRRADGNHRPLRTRPDLRRGWYFQASDVAQLVDALVALYGSAVLHWHAGEEGTLLVRSFASTAARQTGMYSALRRVSAPIVEGSTREACASHSCLRVRAWRTPREEQALPPMHDRTQPVDPPVDDILRVPCPEPCPVLLALALETRADAERGG